MNKQLYKNGEYTECKNKDEYNALSFLIEQDGWPIYEGHRGFIGRYYGIHNDKFMLGTNDTRATPLTEMLFRGAPDWATMLITDFEDSYYWAGSNEKGSREKFVYCANGNSFEFESWFGRVIARRELKPMTKEQKRADLLAQLVALDNPTHIGELLKVKVEPDQQLAAWVKQEAPDWNGEDSVGIWYSVSEWCLEQGYLCCLGSVKMPRELGELLRDKLNSNEWTL